MVGRFTFYILHVCVGADVCVCVTFVMDSNHDDGKFIRDILCLIHAVWVWAPVFGHRCEF